jgi:hypothetical protein
MEANFDRAENTGNGQQQPRHVAEHMPARAAQAFSIGLAGDHQIQPHPQRAQTLAEATPAVHLLLWRELGLVHDHRQIQIRIHPRLPTRPGAEGKHGLHIGFGAQPAKRLAAAHRSSPGPRSTSDGRGWGRSQGIAGGWNGGVEAAAMG